MDKLSNIGRKILMAKETGRELSLDIKIEILKQSIFSGKALDRNKKIILLVGFPTNV